MIRGTSKPLSEAERRQRVGEIQERATLVRASLRERGGTVHDGVADLSSYYRGYLQGLRWATRRAGLGEIATGHRLIVTEADEP